MRFFDNNASNPDAFYEPNSFDGPAEDESYREPPLTISGDADRYNHREGNDDYSQPRALFNLFDDAQRQRLYGNIAEAMDGVPEEIIQRQLSHFHKVDPEYARGVARTVGLEVEALDSTG